MYGHHHNILGTTWFCKTMLMTTKRSKRTFSVPINKLISRFNWLSLTNLERELQVELQMTGLLSLLEQKGLLNVLMIWLTLLLLPTLQLITLLEQTGLLTFNCLTSWLTLLALQTLCLVALLEQTCLLRSYSLMSWLILLALQTLHLLALLEQINLLTRAYSRNKGMCILNKKGQKNPVKGHNEGFLLLIFPNLGHLEYYFPLNGMCFWSF